MSRWNGKRSARVVEGDISAIGRTSASTRKGRIKRRRLYDLLREPSLNGDVKVPVS